ncbi:MAG TPA: SDR family NAD(P)-dependent oxidoreductase [Candidatus Acidoferrum sp.]|nr:SDR family NAD(P)-dependent oxidoreductase [Candidatus Acidoferrum sp.]
MELKGSVAIVTGCTGGLGQRICRAFAVSGAQVAGIYVQSKEQAESFAREWTALGPRCVAIQADVNEQSQIPRAIGRVMEEFGRIDVLVNNAAYNQLVPFKDLEGLTLDIWDHILLANLTSPFMCVKAVAPIMLKQKRGRIVNVASIAGLAPLGSSIAYAVSKAGLIHLTRCLAVALGPDVAVNAVAPGTMMGTRMTNRLDPALIERTTKNAALQKPVERDDVAHQVLEFCRSDSTTGQVLILDSGVVYH